MSTPRPRVATTSTYTELARQVRESGLMARRYRYYWSLLVAGVLALTGLALLVVQLGDSWLQLLVAAALGGVLAQLGFLGHDAAHRQVFVSAAWNEWTARLVSGALVGLSYGWWRDKHNRHHGGPNQRGRDPDIGPGVLAMTPEIAAARTGLAGWLCRRQGWLLIPLLTLEGLSLHVAGVTSLVRSRDRHRTLELTLICGRLGGLLALVLVVLPPGKAAAFVAVQLAVFGLLLGGSFAPNHIGMPLVERTVRLDFLDRQVRMSRNVSGSAILRASMGGLDLQIEHHLFPSMPRPALRQVQPLVRAHCAAVGVPYTEVGLVASYAAVIDHLNHVGIRARTTFDCPLATQLRG